MVGHGSYRQVWVNSRTFQGLLKDLPAVFKDYKIMKMLIYTMKFYFRNARPR